MDGNAVLIIIIGLIGIAIGFALGVAVASLREPRHEKRVVDTAQIERRIRVPEARPVAPAEAVPTQAPVQLPVTPLVDLSTTPARPSLNTVDVLARALQPDLRTPEPPPLSITAQIDEILQEMLKNSPLAARLIRSEEHTSELQSPTNIVCRLLLEKKKRESTNQPLGRTTLDKNTGRRAGRPG